MMNEMGVSSHKGRYSGHFLVNISRAVVIFGARRVRYKMLTNIEFTVMQLFFFEKQCTESINHLRI